MWPRLRSSVTDKLCITIGFQRFALLLFAVNNRFHRWRSDFSTSMKLHSRTVHDHYGKITAHGSTIFIDWHWRDQVQRCFRACYVQKISRFFQNMLTKWYEIPSHFNNSQQLILVNKLGVQKRFPDMRAGSLPASEPENVWNVTNVVISDLNTCSPEWHVLTRIHLISSCNCFWEDCPTQWTIKTINRLRSKIWSLPCKIYLSCSTWTIWITMIMEADKMLSKKSFSILFFPGTSTHFQNSSNHSAAKEGQG